MGKNTTLVLLVSSVFCGVLLMNSYNVSANNWKQCIATYHYSSL